MRGTFWERNNKPAMAFFLAIEALLKYNKLP